MDFRRQKLHMELSESKFGYIRERYPDDSNISKSEIEKKIIKGFIYATTIENKNLENNSKVEIMDLLIEEHLFLLVNLA